MKFRLRPPRSEDKQRVADCFAVLSWASRRLRFFAAKGSLTDQELEFLTLVDGRDHIALAALSIDPTGAEGRLVGMARCPRLPSQPDRAELAMTVADPFQGLGLGLGRRLVEQLMQIAGTRGIHRLELEILSENSRMRALAEHFGGIAVRHADGMLHYEIALPTAEATETPPTDPWSWLEPASGLARRYRDWLEVFDETLHQAHRLTESIRDAIWEIWLPRSSNRVIETTRTGCRRQ